MGDGPTRDNARHECVCECCVKRGHGGRSEGLDLRRVCPVSASCRPFRQEPMGPGQGSGQGAATTNLVGQLELSTRKCRESSLVPAYSQSPVSPFPISPLLIRHFSPRAAYLRVSVNVCVCVCICAATAGYSISSWAVTICAVDHHRD